MNHKEEFVVIFLITVILAGSLFAAIAGLATFREVRALKVYVQHSQASASSNPFAGQSTGDLQTQANEYEAEAEANGGILGDEDFDYYTALQDELDRRARAIAELINSDKTALEKDICYYLINLGLDEGGGGEPLPGGGGGGGTPPEPDESFQGFAAELMRQLGGFPDTSVMSGLGNFTTGVDNVAHDLSNVPAGGTPAGTPGALVPDTVIGALKGLAHIADGVKAIGGGSLTSPWAGVELDLGQLGSMQATLRIAVAPTNASVLATSFLGGPAGSAANLSNTSGGAAFQIVLK